jgi:hypothetical protein
MKHKKQLYNALELERCWVWHSHGKDTLFHAYVRNLMQAALSKSPKRLKQLYNFLCYSQQLVS